MANPKKYPPCILKRFSMNSIEYPPEKIDNHTSSLPSGKLTYSYVKSPSLIGKSTTNYKCAIFYSYVKLQEGTAISRPEVTIFHAVLLLMYSSTVHGITFPKVSWRRIRAEKRGHVWRFNEI